MGVPALLCLHDGWGWAGAGTHWWGNRTYTTGRRSPLGQRTTQTVGAIWGAVLYLIQLPHLHTQKVRPKVVSWLSGVKQLVSGRGGIRTQFFLSMSTHFSSKPWVKRKMITDLGCPPISASGRLPIQNQNSRCHQDVSLPVQLQLLAGPCEALSSPGLSSEQRPQMTENEAACFPLHSEGQPPEAGNRDMPWEYFRGKPGVPTSVILLPNWIMLSFFFLLFYFLFIFERQHELGKRQREGEGDTESEAGSRLRDVSTESNAGLDLTNRESMTWA